MTSLSFGRSASTLESCSQKSQAGGTATALSRGMMLLSSTLGSIERAR